jgi:FkbM family methyltransferase
MTRFEIWLRSWLRRTGLTRVLRAHWELRSHRHRLEYRHSRPTSFQIGVDGWTGTMLVGSEGEYTMLRSKKEDYALVRVLGERLPKGGTYWDVGSSIGFYAVLVARIVGDEGQVLAFEPEPRSRARLQQNVDANGLRNVRVLPLALGREPGSFKLAVEDAFAGGSHRVVAVGGAAAPTGRQLVDVQVVPGDALRRSEAPPLTVPDAIKIDVEGAELDVLAGLQQTLRDPRCRTLLCEVHFTLLEERGLPNGPLEVERALRESGFQELRWVDRSHLLACK